MKQIIKNTLGHSIRTFTTIILYLTIFFGLGIRFSLDKGREFLIRNYVHTPLSYLLDYLVAAIPIVVIYVLAYKKNIKLRYRILACALGPSLIMLNAFFITGDNYRGMYGEVMLVANFFVFIVNELYYRKKSK